VKRSKPPVLTSPWKIGFFVALMLVVVSSAVAYFFVRKTGLTWALPQWTDWNSILISVTQNRGTIFELWPLLAVVTLTALLSYFVITRAVRMYKGYLDSGHDYKDLLASIKQIADLEDKNRIGRLQNHPELRDFLIGIREKAAARTKDLDQREESLARREEGDAAQAEQDLSNRLSSDCERLVTAIHDAADAGFPDDIELARPELHDVEQALRKALATPSSQPAVTGEQIGRVRELTRELALGIETGIEIENYLRESVTGSAPTTDTSQMRQEIEALLASLADASQLSSSLLEVDEITKNIAINAAQTAGSGTGTQTDLVNLADEVKSVAAKFGEMANSWTSLAEAMAGHVRTIETELAVCLDSVAAGSKNSDATTKAADKLTRYIEHLHVLVGQMNSVTDTSPESAITPESPNDGEVAQTEQADDYGFETIDHPKPLFTEDNDDVSEMPGLERQPNQVVAEAADDKMFAELGDTPTESTPIEHDEALRVQDTHTDDHIEPTPDTVADETSDGAGEFVMERNMVDLPSEDEAASADDSEDANVIDLYELGAIDYDAAVHN